MDAALSQPIFFNRKVWLDNNISSNLKVAKKEGESDSQQARLKAIMSLENNIATRSSAAKSDSSISLKSSTYESQLDAISLFFLSGASGSNPFNGVRILSRSLGNGSATKSLRRLLIEAELIASASDSPDKYHLPSGEDVLDFFISERRISCIFDDSYCHILGDSSEGFCDKFFEGGEYSIGNVTEYFRSLIENKATKINS